MQRKSRFYQTQTHSSKSRQQVKTVKTKGNSA